MPSFPDAFGSPAVLTVGWIRKRHILLYPLTVEDVGVLFRRLNKTGKDSGLSLDVATMMLWLSTKQKMSWKMCKRMCRWQSNSVIGVIKILNPGLLIQPTDDGPPEAQNSSQAASAAQGPSKSVLEKRTNANLGDFLRNCMHDGQMFPDQFARLTYTQFLTVSSKTDPEMQHIKTLKDWEEYWEEDK